MRFSALDSASAASSASVESLPAYISELPKLSSEFTPFVPARWLRGGHRQTLAGVFWPLPKYDYRATQYRVTLDDGDEVVLHDDCPAGWKTGDRAALLIHGLTGSYQSHYMLRTAHKLNERGIRTFRLDLRGCGAGIGLARWPYHCGRSEDARAALLEIARLCPASPTTIVGFSLGGNITIKLLGELQGEACGGLDSAIVVCPPIDLARCSENLSRFPNRIYDKHFVKHMVRAVHTTRQLRPDLPFERFQAKPRKIVDFDHQFTAPLGGYRDVETYYEAASGLRYLPLIRYPTLLTAPHDDPMIPLHLYDRAEPSPWVDLIHPAGGGHLGFVARRGIDPDPRWMDWRILDWIAGWERLKGRSFANRETSSTAL
jgi:predicted alpha/beta-fold hydrolase